MDRDVIEPQTEVAEWDDAMWGDTLDESLEAPACDLSNPDICESCT